MEWLHNCLLYLPMFIILTTTSPVRINNQWNTSPTLALYSSKNFAIYWFSYCPQNFMEQKNAETSLVALLCLLLCYCYWHSIVIRTTLFFLLLLHIPLSHRFLSPASSLWKQVWSTWKFNTRLILVPALITTFLPRCIDAGRSFPRQTCPSVCLSQRELWQNEST